MSCTNNALELVKVVWDVLEREQWNKRRREKAVLYTHRVRAKVESNVEH